MSHFTRVRTQLRNLSTVRLALEDLGYAVEEGGAVRGHNGHQTADLVVKFDGKYDLGFTEQKSGEVVMVADFWGLKINQSDFLNQVTQRYAYHTVLEQAHSQGFHVTTEESQQDGSVRLVVQRW